MQKFASRLISTLVVSTSLWGGGTAIAQEPDSETSGSGNGSVLQQDAPSKTDGYLTDKPDNAFYADDLIGNSVMTKRDEEDQEIGPISDLVIDEFGQVVALVVGAGAGGFMGMGVKELAIPWETIELTRKEGEDRYTVYTDVDVEILKDAPEFDKD
ncbi:PRC-barrel domain-containing protein [Halomonas sp. TRM85114]|uniref:PRC-barrel domain-containing protein n=1 Tax=Halomonas jincaotanensis TaxID=2810616 RepID=UPI001BD4F284|nr:PRC-barrel domain-containing protein [Halomonas jincaotanensis]MBS9402214.1 PRC-barrel domain-containing protein [Halomonas jincaotanensis]